VKSEEYWVQRMETLNDSLLAKAESHLQAQSAEHDKAMAKINRQTESWYARLAKNNKVSMAEARSILSANELKEFHWDLDEYRETIIKHGGDPNWKKQIENARARIHISKLDEQRIRMQQEIEVLAAKRLASTTDALAETYQEGYYRSLYEVQRGVGTGVPFARLDKRQIAAVLSKPWTPDGRNFSSLAELTMDLEKKMGVSKQAAERLIRTEAAFFSGQSRLEGHKQQGVTHYKYVSTLDNRTSDVCQDMDGQVIPVDEAKAGVNYPPLHANCRSTTIPYDEDSPPGLRVAKDKDGKEYTVPSDMTYKEWAAKYAEDAAKPLKLTEQPRAVDPPAVRTVDPAAPSPQTEVPELTREEEGAVLRYVGGESYVLNDKLRRGEMLNSDEMQWVERLDKALSKLPAYAGDLSRSLYFASSAAASAFMADIEPGSVIQYPQYISTTAAAESYNAAGQVQFYILNAAAGKDMTAYNPGELEVLYGRDWPFVVEEIEVINGVYYILLRELKT
jgi:SPP1 gp7 family putative phage head morphogenesis protein